MLLTSDIIHSYLSINHQQIAVVNDWQLYKYGNKYNFQIGQKVNPMNRAEQA